MNPRPYEEKIIGFPKKEYRFKYGHRLVYNTTGETFYIVPKMRVFEKYGLIFNKDIEGGESINRYALSRAVEYDALLVFVYHLTIRTIKAADFMNFAEKNNTFRIEEKTFEETASVPLSLLKTHNRWIA